MSRQYFSEVLTPIMTADQTAVTGTTEVALWPVSPWTALNSNQLQPGQCFRLKAWGIITTAGASPGTLTVTPRYGTTTGGTTLGASAASATLAVSQTNVPWYLDLNGVCRSIGTAGTMVANGTLDVPASVLASSMIFGSTTATVDTTIAAGIFLGVTLGSASDSMTTKGLYFELLN